MDEENWPNRYDKIFVCTILNENSLNGRTEGAKWAIFYQMKTERVKVDLEFCEQTFDGIFRWKDWKRIFFVLFLFNWNEIITKALKEISWNFQEMNIKVYEVDDMPRKCWGKKG